MPDRPAIIVFLCLAGALNVEAMTTKTTATAQMGTAAKMQTEATLAHRSNPVQKVVKILEDMQKETEKNQIEDRKQYDEVICWCQTQGVKIKHEIEELQEKTDGLDSDINETKADIEGDKKHIEDDQKKYGEDEDDIKKAKILNEKEMKAYQETKATYQANIDALRRAIAALEKAKPESFLQTPQAAVLKKLVQTFDMDDTARDEVTAFLEQDQSYTPGSGEVIGILKQMKDEMQVSLAQLVRAYKLTESMYDKIVAAKLTEEEKLQQEIRDYMRRLAEEGIKLAEDKGYRTDFYDSLLTDEEYMRRLHVRCHDFKDEYTQLALKQRDELKTIAAVLKMIGDDDAREMFNRVLPSEGASSFIQLQRSQAMTRQRALDSLRRDRPRPGKGDYRLNLLSIALQSKKISLDKVISQVNGLIGILKIEQTEDDDKKTWCLTELQQTEQDMMLKKEDIKRMEAEYQVKVQKVEDLNKAISTSFKEVSEITASVEKETKLRKELNNKYLSGLASNKAAISILKMAITRLNKFYNEAEYHKSIGFEGVQRPVATVRDPSPDMEVRKFENKSGGVISALNKVIDDIELMTQEMEINEKDQQKEYDELIENSKERKDELTRLIVDSQLALSGAEKEEIKFKNDLQYAKWSIADDEKTLAATKAECRFLLSYYAVRKSARKREIENLGEAKSVLQGADVDFIQTGRSTRHLRGGLAKA